MNNSKTAGKRRKRRKRSSWTLPLILGGVTVTVLLVGLLIFWLMLAPYRNYPLIIPGVSYDGIELSGYTRQQAKEVIEQEISSRKYTVEVDFPDGEQFMLAPEQTVSVTDIDAVLDEAWSKGRESGSTTALYRAVKHGRPQTVTTRNQLTYDRADLQAQIEDMIREISTEPTEPTGAADTQAGTVSITTGQPGRTANANALYQEACGFLDNATSGVISAGYEEVPCTEEQLTAAVDELLAEYAQGAEDAWAQVDPIAHTITLCRGNPGWVFDGTELYNLAKSAGSGQTVSVPLTQVFPEDVNLDEICTPLMTEPVEVEYHDGALTGGESGYTLDLDSVKDQFNGLDWGETMEVALEEIPPAHTLEEVESKLFRNTLGSCSTAHTYDSDRTTNLRLACQEIDGIVLNPGSVFSFNTFVGERTEEKGYRKAIVYVDGDSVDDDGGGVCQVVSTLYNAVLRANLEVTDRMGHQFLVTYVAGGLDATVYWGIQDFCFKNTSEYPIRVNATVSGGYVQISISGTNDTGEYVTLSSNLVSSDAKTISYQAYSYLHDSYGNVLEKRDLGITTYDRHTN